MYETHWKLESKPFENTPDARFFWLSPEHSEALDRLSHLLRERKGAGMLTGEYGCGKTTMVEVLDERLDLGQHRVAYLDYPRLKPGELLGEILRQFGEDPDGDNVSRMHRLGEMFFHTALDGAHSIVIVDEAQIIPDDMTLEELRLLLNFQLENEHLVTLLLIGEPELRERVIRLPALDRKIAVRYHLQAFDLDQTGSYVAYRMERAGAETEVFTPDAVEAIYEKSHGTPREINSVCDMCLFVGARKGLEKIDGSAVRKVA
ncbi:MAG: AAA family ATPase [Gemmatimonadota bacterium]|nr:AAA family ATPase [Gemmatimonadota bacterium]